MHLRQWQLVCKRLTDIVGAVIALLVAFPLMVAIALSIKLTSTGPVLYRQSRTGLRGIPFVILKFRTMTTETVVEAGRETLSTDPRITTVGRWLRCFALDELPQLVNVLVGDMSLVGPRPLLEWENDLCDARQAQRLSVRPGLTGLSQVNGRNSIPWSDRVAWDVKYVEQASLRLDLLILLKTLPVALRGENAYRDQEPMADLQPSILEAVSD